MKIFSSLYHFLGSVYFALILIAAVAVFVIAGTFLESFSQSHLYAAQFIYDSSFFGLLLWGFFINILFAATRRWPFKVRHIPFLITHLGLLMVLGGVLMKHYFGIQGTLHIMEGSGSHDVHVSETYAVSVQKRGEASPVRYPIKMTYFGGFDTTIAKRDDGLVLHLAEFSPHSSEHLATWVKGSFATISGLNPMPMNDIKVDDAELPLGGRVRFHSGQDTVWDLYALKAVDLKSALSRLYCQKCRLVITKRLSGEVVADDTLEKFLDRQVFLPDGSLAAGALSLPFSPLSTLENPQIKISIRGKEAAAIPLNGPNALLNINTMTPYIGQLPLAFDIVRPPFFAIIEDSFGDVYLAAADPHGRLWLQPVAKGLIDTIIAYDDGYGGYAVKTDLPFNANDRKTLELAQVNHIQGQLKKTADEGIQLSPPLEAFRKACVNANADFAEALTAFLFRWNASHSWLYPESLPLSPQLQLVFSGFDWKGMPSHIYIGCKWCHALFEKIGPALESGQPPLDVLHEAKWPLLNILKEEYIQVSAGKDDPEILLTLLSQQVFAAAEMQQAAEPVAENSGTPERQAALFSAYLRISGIHINDSSGPPEMEEGPPISLETSIAPFHRPLPPGKKLEDNFPSIVVHASKGKVGKSISLSYDRSGSGLKWPMMNGEYLIRFQPNTVEIPYHVRLRQARQINYANSNQAYSYESDLIITDQRSGATVEKTISMNRVHETWDGYRFYLSTIAPPDESAVKRIQIVVNRDPAKYWLTYPGAIILSCGILLLFMMRPYKNNDK